MTFPLFIHEGGEVWRQPIDLPPVLAALLTLWLTYLVARRIFPRRRTAIVAAVLLPLTPAFLAYSRSGTPELFVVPCLLFWLWSVVAYLDRPRRWLLLLGGVSLGTSVYTQPAGVLSVPIFLAIGCAALGRSDHLWRACALAATGVLLPLVLMVPWYWSHPETYLDTMGRWAIHPAHVRNPWQGLVAFTKWDVMSRRAGAYWEYFNPVFLFLSGEVFVVAMVVLMGTALVAGRRHARTPGFELVVAGLVAAPLAAVLLDAPRSAGLAIAMIPFGALLGAHGLETLLWRNPPGGMYHRVPKRPSRWSARESAAGQPGTSREIVDTVHR